MPLDLEVIDDFSRAPDAEVWNGALGGAVSDVVFLTRQYQQTWWDAFCSSSSLNLIVLRDGGNPVGYAPFYLSRLSAAGEAEERARAADWRRVLQRHRSMEEGGEAPRGRTAAGDATQEEAEPPDMAPRAGERILRLVGGVDVTDYLDIIAPPAALEELWPAVLDHWARRADEWDVIDLHSLPGWSPSAGIVRRSAEERGWKVWCDVEETCPVAELPGTWEDYLSLLSKKDRHELRRKLRRSEEQGEGIEYRLLREPGELSRGFEQFLILHRKSDEAKAKFMSPEMERFFRALMAATAETGWPEIALLESHGRAVAAYLSFLYAGRIHLYNSGFDPSQAGYSAGFVLLVRRLQDAVEGGVKYFDFLRGDERYKYDLGGRDNFIYRVIIRQ